MKISSKLLLLASVMSALLIGVGIVGIEGMRSSNTALKTVYEDRTIALGQLGEIQFRMLSNAYILSQVTEATPSEDLNSMGEQLDTNIATISELWRAYIATYLTPEEAELANKFADANVNFLNLAVKTGRESIRSGDNRKVQRINETLVRPTFAPANNLIDKLIQLQIEVARSEYNESARYAQILNWVAISSMLIGLLFAIGLSYVLISGITRSMHQAFEASLKA